jgi:hypothetical protein
MRLREQDLGTTVPLGATWGNDPNSTAFQGHRRPIPKPRRVGAQTILAQSERPHHTAATLLGRADVRADRHASAAGAILVEGVKPDS